MSGGANHTYTYGNGNWLDLLTEYDKQSITYDAIGNPSSYYNGIRWNFTGKNGRQLTGATAAGKSLTFTYGMDGIRDSKTSGGTKYSYLNQNGRVMRQTWGGNFMDFIYDNNGRPAAMVYNNTTYYYVLNLQGDVIRIVDATGASKAEYTYDAWGRILSATGTLAGVNPIRYRGYYYDSETGFYYVGSRYYDPQIKRFINADDVAYLGANADFISYNLYTYCGNNPVIGYDPYGTFDFWKFAKGVGRVATGVGAVAAGVTVLVAGAPVAMIAVAVITISAGVLTTTNGVADVQQSVTGNNFVRDTIFNGNQTIYDVYSTAIQITTIVGTTFCGNYLINTCTMKGAVPGTVGKVKLESGTILDRYGSQYGRYLTDPGTTVDKLALTPGNSGNLTTYMVNRPFTFSTGTVAACPWGPGGGVQYFSWMSVQRLVQFGILTPLG